MPEQREIARCYDRNTARFLRFGGGAGALAIHRELWGPGITSSTDAKRYVNQLIGDVVEARAVDQPVVLDLGCGVGGTLFDIAARFPAGTTHGVTISAAQHELAEAWAERRGLAGRCVFHRGDYHALELAPPHERLARPRRRRDRVLRPLRPTRRLLRDRGRAPGP